MSKIKVLHVTTHDEECGIAKYQEQYIQGMKSVENVENVIFPYSPNKMKNMTAQEFAPVLKEFSEQLKSFDMLHIQHEFSFYKHDELSSFITEAHRQHKKTLMTIHTSPEAGFPKTAVSAGGFGPRSILHRLRAKRAKKHFDRVHLKAMRMVNQVIVHNTVTLKALVKYGVQEDRIIRITMPVPELSFDLKTTEIKDNLNQKDGDIIYCTVGFLSKNKGITHAINALEFLPSNYKLAIIGGAHPSGENAKFYDDVCDLIIKRGLKERVYIAGYVEQDEKLNALIRECDICVYPYDRVYYGGVTSAALNNAIANYKPAIAYPTDSIMEMNQQQPVVQLTDSFNYYELAREIIRIDRGKQEELSKKYAAKFGYATEAPKFGDIYRQLLK
ncbi:MAG TPA: glycosyltransferase [Candidatus Saccharimonadales bacterium]